jgi:ArsR family transcriptional regulator, virulence genes transcriptional regulator
MKSPRPSDSGPSGVSPSTSAAHDLAGLIQNAKAAAEMLKGLAHETRLLMICFLGKGEKNVLELEAILGTTQANISQHLAKLRSLGLVDNRKKGNQVYYRIKDKATLKLVRVLQDAYC